jgi:hypothetical protein
MFGRPMYSQVRPVDGREPSMREFSGGDNETFLDPFRRAAAYINRQVSLAGRLLKINGEDRRVSERLVPGSG